MLDAMAFTVAGDLDDTFVLDDREFALTNDFDIKDGLDHPVERFDSVYHARTMNDRDATSGVADPDRVFHAYVNRRQ